MIEGLIQALSLQFMLWLTVGALAGMIVFGAALIPVFVDNSTKIGSGN